MSQEDVAVVQSAYEAFRRGDVQAIFALLHPEIELYQSEWVPWGGKYKGHEEAGYFFSNLTETIESRVDPDQFIDDEEGHVVAVGHTRGSVRTTRREFEVPIVHVWTIREGKALKFEAYIATFQMRVALALPSVFPRILYAGSLVFGNMPSIGSSANRGTTRLPSLAARAKALARSPGRLVGGLSRPRASLLRGSR